MQMMNVIKITLTTFVEIFIPEYPTFVSSTIFLTEFYKIYFTLLEYNVKRTFITMNTT